MKYNLVLTWERLDMGISFIPSEVPAGLIQSGGRDLSQSEFREQGQDSCDRQT